MSDINFGDLFFDSGAFSLYSKEILSKNGEDDFTYFKSDDFWKYVDRYCSFLESHPEIECYANVDVIFNPSMSWEVLKYMEGRGLRPVPVIHYGTDLSWVDRHLSEGYDFLGIGGIGQNIGKVNYLKWADGLFDRICPKSNNRIPLVRTHGFAMTSCELMCRYPWWSVDSTSWLRNAVFGSIMVPHKRRGVFVFDENPYSIIISDDPRKFSTGSLHFKKLSSQEKMILMEWLDHIKMPLGDENVKGVKNYYNARRIANLKFFYEFLKHIPQYPWRYTPRPIPKGFFFMKIFFSGTTGINPENDKLPFDADVMVSFWDGVSKKSNKPGSRLKKILKVLRRKLRQGK